MTRRAESQAIPVPYPRLAYAQCWEDPDVLRRALRVEPGDDVLSICGAGDNAFALLLDSPRSITCVDHSAAQLALAELKLEAARQLPVQSFRSALGLDALGRRVWFYHHLRPSLGPRARGYFDEHEGLVREGLLGAGAFERGLHRFREQVLSRIHPLDRIERMLALDDPQQQEAMYLGEWDTVRWRGLFRVAFDRRLMARRGRANGALDALGDSVPRMMHGRAARVLCTLSASSNFFLQWYLRGHYPDLERGPPYLTTEGHEAMRRDGGRVRFLHGALLDVLRGCADDSFSVFNLSNIFEYMDEGETQALLAEVARVGRPGARLCYWNLLVPRHRPDGLGDRIERDVALGTALLKQDRAFVYGAVQVEVVC